jgi:hypothetical protein
MIAPFNFLQSISNTPFPFLPDHLINPQENIHQVDYTYTYTNTLPFEPILVTQQDRYSVTSGDNNIQGND